VAIKGKGPFVREKVFALDAQKTRGPLHASAVEQSGTHVISQHEIATFPPGALSQDAFVFCTYTLRPDTVAISTSTWRQNSENFSVSDITSTP